MHTILNINAEKIIPDEKSVIDFISNNEGNKLSDATFNILNLALEEFRKMSNPAGIVKEISKEKFGEIFEGENQNAPDSPIKNIYLNSNNLSIFVVTIGKDISSRIRYLFSQNDYAGSFMLDAVASSAADNAALSLENYFQENLKMNNKFDNETTLLRYSPGYCGWHITGQRKLFDELNPEIIGITLNESYLMQPLKSVSGVIISGRKNIHIFDNNFLFCADCKTISCIERIKSY